MKEETPLQAAHRELFEETGYEGKRLIPYEYSENFQIDDEPAGEKDYKFLKEFLATIDNIVFIAIIIDDKDPILNPIEHTDWKWCDYQSAYDLIMWALEKKQLRLIRKFIEEQNLRENII